MWLACFGLGWLHFLMDYLGSGPGWSLWPWWPVSMTELQWGNAWPFFSWQNLSTFGVMLAITFWIAWRWGRTPLEWITPRLDDQIVRSLRPKRGGPNQIA